MKLLQPNMTLPAIPLEKQRDAQNAKSSGMQKTHKLIPSKSIRGQAE